MDGNFVADVRLEDTDEVLQLPIVKNKLKKLLSTAVKKMAITGATVIPSSDDPLHEFLPAAGKFFGKDPAKWEQMGQPNVEVNEVDGKRYIKSTGTFAGVDLHLLVEEPYFDDRLPVYEDRPEMNYNLKRMPISTDEEWRAVMADQPWTTSKRRTMLTAYLHAKLEADDGLLSEEGCHGFWEMSINRDNHADIRADKLAALMSKLSSSNVKVATSAAAAVWGLATTGDMRRAMADLDVVTLLLAAIKRALKMQVVADSPGGSESLADGVIGEAARARLQLHLQGALAILLVDRCCRRPYLQQEPDFATLFTMCTQLPGYRPADEQVRRETAAKILTSLMQRDGDARLALISSGSLRSVMTLLNPTGPGASMIQFCMASLLATMVLDDDAMDLIRERGEAPILFESCIVLLTCTLDNLHAELDRRTGGYYKAGDKPVYDLYLGVRLAEASSQAMWGSAHYCVQMDPVQVKMEHIVELGKMGRDCLATDQLPLSRACHCVTATLATLSSHHQTAELIMTCPDDVALSTLLLLAEVQESEVFERAGHVKASACAGLAFLACHPLGATGDECMHGPHREKLLTAGTFGTLLRAALTTVMDEDCDIIVQQAAAIGVMYLSTMAGAIGAVELTMYATLLMDNGNSEMIEFLMAGMWILLRNGENRKVLSSSFDPKTHGAEGGMVRNIAHKLNDAIILHEINDQAHEKAAKVKTQIEEQQEMLRIQKKRREKRIAAGLDPDGESDEEETANRHNQISASQSQAAMDLDPAQTDGELHQDGMEDDKTAGGELLFDDEEGNAPKSNGGIADSDVIDTPDAGSNDKDFANVDAFGNPIAAQASAHSCGGENTPSQASRQQSTRSTSGRSQAKIGRVATVSVPSAGLGASVGGQDEFGYNLPRGGGEEGGAPEYVKLNSSKRVSRAPRSAASRAQTPKIDQRFQKQLQGNWGLETLVGVGESWLPAMLEQDELGEATDVPVLKLFEFLVASICLFMVEDDAAPEARQLDMFKFSAPRNVRGPHELQHTWWTVDARSPEPEPVVDQFVERALAILIQIVGMRLLPAWKSLQLGVLTLWNACARNAAMERHVVERGVVARLLSIIHQPIWPPSLRDTAGGCLEFFMERYSNLSFMPPTPLPQTCTWPHATGPHQGIVPAVLGYITLIGSRIPLLEYRGCHGITRICYAAPFGASPEQAREYLRDTKTAAALTGMVDVLIKLLKRTNRRYQDLLSGRQVSTRRIRRPSEPSGDQEGAEDDDSAAFERDMMTVEAQQDIYFVALAGLVNISQLRAAQPLLARKGLLVLLGTSTMLYGRIASAQVRTLQTDAESRLLHLISYILQNVSQHPSNRTLLYKAELLGTTALDKLIEHATEMDEDLKATAALLPPLTSIAHLSSSASNSPRSPGKTQGGPLSPQKTSRGQVSKSKAPRPGELLSPTRANATNGALALQSGGKGTLTPSITQKQLLSQRLSRNGAILNASVDTALASIVRPKVIFPPIVEQKEDVWGGKPASPGATRNLSQSSGRISPAPHSPGVTWQDHPRSPSPGVDDLANITRDSEEAANGSKARFLAWLEATFQGDGLELGMSGVATNQTNSKDANQKCSHRKALWDDVGDWLDVDLESSKALNKLLCRPLNHLWNDAPEARARHGQKRWEPAVSEYREVTSGPALQRPAQRLLSTQLPKEDQGLMAAATQVITNGSFDQETTQYQTGEFATKRPSTREREHGRVALTVLQPHPEVILEAQAVEDVLQEAAAQAASMGRSVDVSELRETLEANKSPGAGKVPLQIPLKVVMGPQRSRQVISFADRILVNDDPSRPTLTMFEHVAGSRVCDGMFPSYQLPNGKKAYMYYNGGVMLDEVAVDAVSPPPRPSTVPQALQQTMPLADVLNLIAKPPGSAPPFIPYKPVPYLAPLPTKHTLPIKRPDLLTAAAFGDLREDNLQLVIQVKKIIKTQITTRVEAIDVAAVEERDPWTLPASIFKPRAKESDVRNFHDTPGSLGKMFERDWARACGKEKFTSMLAREHKGNSQAGGKDDKTMLQEVHDVLLEYYQLVHSAFLYYGASSSNDPYHMGINAFTVFLDECQIADNEAQFIKRSDCDTIFIVCNFQPDKKSMEAAVNLENAMMRYEFVESIVRCAIAKYGRGQATEDVADAVRMLLEKNIASSLPPSASLSSNAFRTERLYTEEVDLLLKRHQVMLKALYSRYRLKPSGGGLRPKMMRLDGWLQMCTDAHLVDGQCTLQDATLAFLWSRMFVMDEIRDYQRYISLTFIDFLEALGRIADRKALPTYEQLEESGYSNVLDWSLEKERVEGAPDTRGVEAAAESSSNALGAAAHNNPSNALAGYQAQDTADQEQQAALPLYVKLEVLLDLLFRRLYFEPANPDMPFNYDGLLKLVKKLDKELGP